jgi:hypothetical protein
MDSDGDKIYIKIVVFDEIYNFVVKAFFIWRHPVEKKRYNLNFFQPQDEFKWKKFEQQSYRSRRKIQFSYKFYLWPTSYEKVTIFWKQTEPYQHVVKILEVFQ